MLESQALLVLKICSPRGSLETNKTGEVQVGAMLSQLSLVSALQPKTARSSCGGARGSMVP